jgi:endo-1,4-beta-mannosidase
VSDAFRLGVNYWPARTAIAWWPMFEPTEVAEDFARIAESGMDSVRLFLRWEDFQPAADVVDRLMLQRLVTVADAASDAGLSLMPTLFTGHMSGVNWIPPWALGGTDRDPRFRVIAGGRVVADGPRNWYADAGIVDAQSRLAAEAAAALAGHGALWAWDLGNENSNCAMPPDRASARAWLERMTAAIRHADDTARITTGLHMEDLEEDRRLGPREVAGACDFLTMHGYPIYARWARSGTDEHLVPFLARITRWLGGGMDVLFSEFGLPTDRHPTQNAMAVDEPDAARYTEHVIEGLREIGCLGGMLWCYADYAPALFETPPLDEAAHERTFGLWRADGSPKPSVRAVTAAVGAPRRPPPDVDWIDIDPDTYWRDPGAHLPRLYARAMAAASPDYPHDGPGA